MKRIKVLAWLGVALLGAQAFILVSMGIANLVTERNLEDYRCLCEMRDY